MKEYTLYREGNFYKGQLHTHTTVSDGEITPEDTKKLYKSEGYSFLAITDHNKYGIYEDFNEDGFIIIPGAELDCIPEGKLNHIVAIGDPETTKFKHGEQLDWLTYSKFQAQELVNYITESNNIAIYAHPYWSYADVEEIAGLKNILGVEIVPDAIVNAKSNAKKNNINTAEFICGAAEDLMPDIVKNQGHIDAVILDPPRKGCDESILQTLNNVCPQKIIYISCDPATLARDLKILCTLSTSKYKINFIRPYDMFPQTKHVETVVCLYKKA
jgi:predicted metal-dependent phosphoesterase TrpH